MTQINWQTEDDSPGIGMYVRDTNGEPKILAAIAKNGWYCMCCPIEGKQNREMLDHVQEHLKPHQI